MDIQITMHSGGNVDGTIEGMANVGSVAKYLNGLKGDFFILERRQHGPQAVNKRNILSVRKK